MVFSFIFHIIFILSTYSLVQLRPYFIQNRLLKEKFSGLKDFSANAFNFTYNYQIILFGGLLNGNCHNQTILLNIGNKTSKVLEIDGTKPLARHSHCSVVHQYKLYIYGGFNSQNQTLQDLWQFNSIFQRWSYIGSSPDSLTSCKLVFNNTNILVFGLDENSMVKILKFNTVSSNWSRLEYKYAKFVKFYGKNSLNTQTITILSIQSLGQSLLNQSNIIFVSSIRTSILNIRNYNGSNLLLLTNSSVLRLQLTTLNIYFVRNLEFHKNIERMQISQKWLFLIHYANKEICLEYFQKNDVHFNGYTTYANPENYSSYQTFIFDGDIFLISEKTFQLYVIEQHCQWIENFTHVHACFYNQIICEEGFTGPVCNITSCPNTLALFDSANFMQIKMECSNNGECTQTGCKCQDGWIGQDCSVFSPKDCKGEIVSNWPVTNCQCLNQTTGGNNCEVTFCYNDCSEHGKCSKQGACICDSGYYGEDCSITIIQFPSSTLSI